MLFYPLSMFFCLLAKLNSEKDNYDQKRGVDNSYSAENVRGQYYRAHSCRFTSSVVVRVPLVCPSKQ
jgi:hypothetical protein